MSDDPARGLAALYPSAKPDANVATPGTPTPKTAAASPASVAPKPAAASPVPASPGTAPQHGKGAWQAPSDAAQPAKAAQPDPPRDPAAAIYGSPMRDMPEAVAATPIPDEAAEHFDMGEEGKQARADVRSAFLAAGASAAETSEMWNMALEAARPEYQPQTYEAAEHDLRAAWGADYDSRLTRARNYMREVARRHPAIVPEIKALGLDVNAKFVAAVEMAARRRGR